MTETVTRTTEMRQWARGYIRRGRAVIPVPAGRKDPTLNDWQNLEISEDEVDRYWTNGQNIGLLWGHPSKGLNEADLDRPEARAVAPYIMKKTKTFGRTGKDHGHRVYCVNGALPKTRQFALPGEGPGRMVLELRSTGSQTLVPPSTYPDGDRCEFGEGEVAEIDREALIRDIEDTATAALLFMNYPGIGARHMFVLRASGYLLRRLPFERVRRIIRAVALAAGDEELSDRLRAVDTTREKIAQGEPVQGGPQLEKLAPGVCKIMRGWFGWGEGRDDGLPRVLVTDRPLRHKSDDAYAAIVFQNDPPELFGRSGQLARIGEDETGEPVVQEVGESRMRHILTRKANFVRPGRNGELVHVSPPEDIVKDVLARPSYGLPPLVGIIRVPSFRPDGSLITTPGYDAATRMFYAPTPGLQIDVPDNPTPGDLKRAISVIDDTIGDFPFADEASATNALALKLTPMLRTVIPGPVPLSVIDKPTMGTGGSLFADVVALTATGGPAGMSHAPKSDEEMRKLITSELRAGNSVIVIDNVAVELSHPSLARGLTAEFWEDRILGRSELIKLPQRATWIASGNNIAIGGDIPRRCYQIRLDAKTEKPWERRSFRHPDLKQSVIRNRGKIVSALLTLGRSWFAEGCAVPEGLPRLGGFESWVSVIGGVLANADLGDHFLGNLDELYAKTAGGAEGWESFLSAWHEIYGDSAKKTKEIAADLLNGEGPYKALKEAMPDEIAEAVDVGGSGLSRKLGNAFAAKEGRRFGSAGFYLKRLPKQQRVVPWKVAKTPSDEPCGVSFVSLVSSVTPNAGTNQNCNYNAQSKPPLKDKARQTHETHETHRRLSEEEARRELCIEDVIAEFKKPSSPPAHNVVRYREEHSERRLLWLARSVVRARGLPVEDAEKYLAAVKAAAEKYLADVVPGQQPCSHSVYGECRACGERREKEDGVGGMVIEEIL